MNAERLEQIRKMLSGISHLNVTIAQELINAVDLFRAANAQTNELRNAERTRLSKRIQELNAEVIDLEQDENPERVYRAEQLAMAAAFEHGRTLAELEHLDANFTQALKDWDDERERASEERAGKDW